MLFPPRAALLGPVTAAVTSGQALLMTLVPHGGQRRARRNAWAAMATDAGRARARREAAAALEAAELSARRRAQAAAR